MKTIRNMFNHLDWANRNMLETLQSEGAGERQVRLFAHLLHAERVWLMRLQGEDSSGIAIWPDADLAHCAEMAERNKKDFEVFFAAAAEEDPDRIVTYANSSGRVFTSSARDILTHVALHGQYHRGQINLLLRRDGLEPINIDYITFAR
ncbi:DinB family protein [Saccharibacillus sp. CPCC 101409]|uniref:DinB family protein n=1 Tax=Saccharibacillus sp. CPCC 101409 TaxID=3058041 RepID=UPI002672FF8F|nr:DinB family protein [Saccharibacillus sp. CPCC 101409]MDO3410561.1 DinB family protein [Saccharibacillus sp. CPCC 101409]